MFSWDAWGNIAISFVFLVFVLVTSLLGAQQLSPLPFLWIFDSLRDVLMLPLTAEIFTEYVQKKEPESKVFMTENKK